MTWSSFHELDGFGLYEILRLRQDVFIIEQDCIYHDIDGLDARAQHLSLYANNTLAGHLRLYPSTPNHMMQIGRVVIAKAFRGQGFGYTLVSEALRFCAEHYAQQSIYLSAQFHLMTFYQRLGFEPQGEPYSEDGIKSIAMLKPASGL